MQRRHPARNNPQSAIRNPQSAFTLIELMISIMIVVILAAIAIPIAGTLNRNESIAGTSRQVRSFLEGARDRAVHDKLPRGVRFLPDKDDPSILTSLVYVGPAGNLSEGTITLSDENGPMTAPGIRKVDLSPANVARTWNRLRAKGLIPDGSILKLRASSGGTLNTYTVFAIEDLPMNPGTYRWYLTKDYVGSLTTLNGAQGDHVLELGNSVLPNQEPRKLESPIDLTNSFYPASWAGGQYDILFSPRGNVIGPAAAAGHVHLVVTSLVDKDAGRTPGDPAKQDPEIIVTITTQTGAITAHSVYSAADKWRNAETGVTTE